MYIHQYDKRIIAHVHVANLNITNSTDDDKSQ